MQKVLLIIGGKSTGLEIREVVDSFYGESFDKVYNVLGEHEGDCPYSSIKDGDVESLLKKDDIELYYIISMVNHKLRRMFVEDFFSKGIKPFNVIHPNSMISNSATLGENIYIASGVIISSLAKVESHVIVNYGALIGHDSIVRENCILNPGCKLGGETIVNENVLIGASTFIKQGVTIGENTLIDAMCYIDRNVAADKMCKNKSEFKEFKNIFK